MKRDYCPGAIGCCQTQKKTKKVLAIGKEAKKMVGKTPLDWEEELLDFILILTGEKEIGRVDLNRG